MIDPFVTPDGSPPTGAPIGRPTAPGSALWRWLPLAGLVGVTALTLAMGWHHYLSFKTIGLHYQDLKAYIADAPLLALAVFVLAYIVVVTLALPVALVMTLTGGLLFGWALGAAASVTGASIGATALFLIVKTSFGATLASKAGPFVAGLRDGFQANALSYLLFLRLVPAFPFFIVNLASALIGVPLSTFVIGTALGIIPGTVAYSLAGAGLGSAVQAQNALYIACMTGPPAQPETACPYVIDFKSLVTPELMWGGIAIGVVALIPVILKFWLKFWSKRHAAA